MAVFLGFPSWLGLQGFEQKKTEVRIPFSPRHVKSACCQRDDDHQWPLDHLIEAVSAGQTAGHREATGEAEGCTEGW